MLVILTQTVASMDLTFLLKINEYLSLEFCSSIRLALKINLFYFPFILVLDRLHMITSRILFNYISN